MFSPVSHLSLLSPHSIMGYKSELGLMETLPLLGKWHGFSLTDVIFPKQITISRIIALCWHMVRRFRRSASLKAASSQLSQWAASLGLPQKQICARTRSYKGKYFFMSCRKTSWNLVAIDVSNMLFSEMSEPSQRCSSLCHRGRAGLGEVFSGPCTTSATRRLMSCSACALLQDLFWTYNMCSGKPEAGIGDWGESWLVHTAGSIVLLWGIHTHFHIDLWAIAPTRHG